MLRRGGNAVDAAVAASFALSVVRPYSCGIGGGGFMVIRLVERGGKALEGPETAFINYRETAPAAVHEEMFETIEDPDAATHGGRAVCVPGHVAGMLLALEKYGTLPRDVVLAPAIRLAEEGFIVDRHYADTMRTDDLVLPWFEKSAARRERFGFLWKRYLLEGTVKEGDRIHVPEQAAALRLIAEKGRDGFYKGPVAEAIVRAVNADGGAMTLADLAGYAPVEDVPLKIGFRGGELLTAPPPSSGGIVFAQVLAMLERRPELVEAAMRAGHNSPAYVHLLAECFKHSFADRARWMADPRFVPVPMGRLLAPAYLDELARRIDPERTLPDERYGVEDLPEDGGTSHLCVIDERGNAVACTETVNLIFGSMVIAEPYGFVLNDEMDDFLTRMGRENAFGLSHATRNRPAPGKRPLSSMTPTMLVGADGGVRLIVGGSGGPRIISGSIQAALNVLLFGMDADRAVAAGRFHHQWKPARIDLESAIASEELRAALRAKGHGVGERKAVGNVQLIRAAEKGGWQAASDRRKGGLPAGY